MQELKSLFFANSFKATKERINKYAYIFGFFIRYNTANLNINIFFEDSDYDKDFIFKSLSALLDEGCLYIKYNGNLIIGLTPLGKLILLSYLLNIKIATAYLLSILYRHATNDGYVKWNRKHVKVDAFLRNYSNQTRWWCVNELKRKFLIEVIQYNTYKLNMPKLKGYERFII